MKGKRMLSTRTLEAWNALSAGISGIKGTHVHIRPRLVEWKLGLVLLLLGESSTSTTEDLQPQAASQTNTDSDGLSESQTEDVNEMLDSGRNQQDSELDGNSVKNDDVATVSVERDSNEKIETSNFGEMCTDADLVLRDDDTFSEISDIGSQCGNVEDVYTLQDINDFLDVTFGRNIEVKDFFPDVDKFIHTVKLLHRNVLVMRPYVQRKGSGWRRC